MQTGQEEILELNEKKTANVTEERTTNGSEYVYVYRLIQTELKKARQRL